jgi:hypothetical protein
MQFERSIWIDRPPADVLAFLRDKHTHPQAPGSPVLLLEKTTPGPAGLGTCYREVVRFFPGFKGHILSRITRYEPPHVLEEEFAGAGMSGHLAYEFRAEASGTLLIQRQAIYYRGLLALLEPLLRLPLLPRIEQRLAAIKADLESPGELHLPWAGPPRARV